jgi:uncharacterized protein (TIGR00730 family)
MKRLLVFCGSNPGVNPEYVEKAYELGAHIAATGKELVYGGAKIGLMGAIANGALDKGGKVIGVIPEFLTKKEVLHTGLSELVVVETMHERKAKMMFLGHAIITLPGGFGTMEELFEALTWSQLDLHQKPIGVLNINGYYNNLNDQISNMVDQGFLHQANQKNLFVEKEIHTLLQLLEDNCMAT